VDQSWIDVLSKPFLELINYSALYAIVCIIWSNRNITNFEVSAFATDSAHLNNMWLLVVPLCQIWWEQAASMTACSTVTVKASGPAVSTSVCA